MGVSKEIQKKTIHAITNQGNDKLIRMVMARETPAEIIQAPILMNDEGTCARYTHTHTDTHAHTLEQNTAL